MPLFSLNCSPTWMFGATVLSAIGIYVFFGPETTTKRKKGHPTGLVNYGNNCFANVIIQCLSSSSKFIVWLEKQVHSKTSPLADNLLQLIYSINGNSFLSSQSSTTVANVIECLRQPQWTFEQQDSHEFFLYLLTSLTSIYSASSSEQSLFTLSQSDDDNQATEPEDVYYHHKYKLKNGEASTSIHPLMSPHPFQGLQATQLECTECKHKNPITVSLFESLSLTIPARRIQIFSNQKGFTLEELIGNYFKKKEMINDLKCGNCKSLEKKPFRKVTTFTRLPEILCIHIVRATWSNSGVLSKETVHISFPDILSMDNFVALKQMLPTNYNKISTTKELKQRRYRLNSVIVHIGGVGEFGGHFVVYRRKLDSDTNWLLISDDSVRDCTQLEVFLSNAYMLFYERIRSDESSVLQQG